MHFIRIYRTQLTEFYEFTLCLTKCNLSEKKSIHARCPFLRNHRQFEADYLVYISITVSRNYCKIIFCFCFYCPQNKYLIFTNFKGQNGKIQRLTQLYKGFKFYITHSHYINPGKQDSVMWQTDSGVNMTRDWTIPFFCLQQTDSVFYVPPLKSLSDFAATPLGFTQQEYVINPKDTAAPSYCAAADTQLKSEIIKKKPQVLYLEMTKNKLLLCIIFASYEEVRRMGDTDYEQRHMRKGRGVLLLSPSRRQCSLLSIFFNKYAFVLYIKKINFLVSLLVFKSVLVSHCLT